MGTRRSCLGLCSLDGLLYAVGGYDGASCLNSVERYDPLTGIWSCCPALSQRRRYCRLTSLDGCVWAVGGLDASNAIATVERLDPREGKWVSVPALSQRRSSAGLAALGTLKSSSLIYTTAKSVYSGTSGGNKNFTIIGNYHYEGTK